MWVIQDKPASRRRPSKLKVVTRIGPAGVEREGMLVESKRPRIISLVLDVFSCTWLLVVQISKERTKIVCHIGRGTWCSYEFWLLTGYYRLHLCVIHIYISHSYNYIITNNLMYNSYLEYKQSTLNKHNSLQQQKIKHLTYKVLHLFVSATHQH